LALYQAGHQGSRPQAEVQSMLAGIAAIDPAENLLLLTGRQSAGARPVAGLERSAFKPTPGFAAAAIHL